MSEPRVPMDKQARREERARINRLSRLPFLYDFALRGRAQALVSTLVQVVVAIVVTMVGALLLTGDALPRYVALLALAVAYAMQAMSRYLNARAGRR